MASTLVYFSRSGHTRKVAEAIATRCGADLEQIRDLRDRRGFLGYLRSAREALKGRPADILPPLRNVEDYDLVALGTPVWADHVSSPMRAYIAAHEPARASGVLLHARRFACEAGSRRNARALRQRAASNAP